MSAIGISGDVSCCHNRRFSLRSNEHTLLPSVLEVKNFGVGITGKNGPQASALGTAMSIAAMQLIIAIGRVYFVDFISSVF